jgi:hypothetical protein
MASIKNDKSAKTESTSETSTPKLSVRTSVRAGAGGSRWHF